MFVKQKGEPYWSISIHDTSTYEETKRFISALLDNLRTKSNRIHDILDRKHNDWYSIYLRDQTEVNKIFEERNMANSLEYDGSIG
jgi:hypothetical protein